jgi:hypothetical protein
VSGIWARLKSIGNVTRPAYSWLFRANANHVIAFFAGTTFLATSAYVYYARQQWQTMDRQLQTMQSSVVQNGKVLRQSIIQSQSARESANAAKGSADTSAKQLEAAERPWISFELSLASPLVFDKDGATLTVTVLRKNIGSSPAIRVQTSAIWFPVFLRHPDPTKKLMDLCKQTDSNASIPITPDAISKGINFMSQTIFPEQPSQQRYLLHLSPADIEQGVHGIFDSLNFGVAHDPKDRSFDSVVEACIGYHASFIGTQYRTGMVMNLSRHDFSAPGASVLIQAVPGTIPASGLRLFIDPIFGTYAN